MRLQIDRLTLAIALAFGLTAKGPAALALDTDQAAAQQDFLELCSDCHGSDARGNGPMTKNLTKIPPDLTQISKRAGGKFDEKAVFDWIIGLNMPTSHGTREMPIWGDWLMNEAVDDNPSVEAVGAAEKQVEGRVMALVKFLKSLQDNK